MGISSRTFKRHISFAEEVDLLPSYMVYFAGCNLRCGHCAQAPAAFGDHGELVCTETLASECREMVRRGARSINLVGGEPSLHVHTILDLADLAGPLPLVLNSNMTMAHCVLDWLDGIVETYLVDIKFGNDRCALELADATDYWQTVTRNVLVAAGQGKLIIRHLLLPGHVDCCFIPVARWVADCLPEARFHLMTTYVPTETPRREMRRLLRPKESARARYLATEMGLRLEGSGDGTGCLQNGS